jgi:hypothetical protein
MTYLNVLRIRVRVVEYPTTPPAETWLLETEPADLKVDESQLDQELEVLFHSAGSHSALLLERTLRSGGWGLSGLATLDYVLTVSTAVISTVAGNAAWAGIQALVQRFTNQVPTATRTQPKRSETRRSKMPTSQRPPTRKARKGSKKRRTITSTR